MFHSPCVALLGRFFMLLLAVSAPRLLARQEAPAPSSHPRGEWYHTGYQMALEARPSFRLLEVPDSAALTRVPRILGGMGINIKTLTAGDLALLSQGWQDGILGNSPALTWPETQVRSILPPELRGFHQFSGDIEDEKKALEAAEKARQMVIAEQKRREEEAERRAMEEQKRIAEAKRNESLADKAARWKRSVVKVRVTLDDGTGHGTGFFIGPGLIVTNQHVIEGARDVRVVLEQNQSVHPATVVAYTSKPDVALVRIDWQDNEFLPVGNSDKCRELEEVVMIGYPRFANQTATYVKGSISSTRRVFRDCHCMQLDIRANGGNSGGPVVTTDGTVVGILTFGLGAIDPTLAQFVFAQHMSSILPFLQQNASDQFRYIDE